MAEYVTKNKNLSQAEAFMTDKNENGKQALDEKETRKQPPVFDDDFGPDHVWQDDGTTSFADMDLTRPVHQQKRTKRADLDLTKKEMRALRRAAFARYLPPLICAVCGFTIAMIIITLWLS